MKGVMTWKQAWCQYIGERKKAHRLRSKHEAYDAGCVLAWWLLAQGKGEDAKKLCVMMKRNGLAVGEGAPDGNPV